MGIARHRTAVLVALTAVTGFTVVAVVKASIPSGATGRINACYKNSSTNQGSLRVIDAEAGQGCGIGEVSLTWNQAGVQGPIGPQGPQGAEGPAGTTATSHVFFTSFAAGGVPGSQGVILSAHNIPQSVLTLAPPPGAYVVEAKVDMFFATTRGDDSSQVYCGVPKGGTTVFLDSSERPGTLQASTNAQRGITAAIDHPGGALTLICTASSSDVPTYVKNASLLATPVGAINPQ